MKNFKGMLISSLAITTFAGVGTTFVTNTVHAPITILVKYNFVLIRV